MLRVVTLTLAVLLPLTAERVLADPAGPARSYQLVADDTVGERRILAVRLAARLPEAGLRRIAEDVARRGRSTPRVMVKFYLADMPQDQAPWATATITAETTVAIGGLSLEDAELLAAEARADRRALVGVWLTSPPAAPGRLTIYREGARTFAEWRLRSGLKTVDALDETRVTRGRRYTIAGETTGSLVVTHAGDLELREGEAVIAKGERIPLDKASAPPVAAAPAKAAPVTAGVGLPSAPGASEAGGPVAPAAPAASGPPMALGAPPAAAAAEVRGEPATEPAAPVTAAPKAPARKRVARPAVPKAAKPARVVDSGPIMRLPGQ